MAWKDLIPWGRNAMSPLLREMGYAWLTRHPRRPKKYRSRSATAQRQVAGLDPKWAT
jgi:hypothetical protein